MFILGCVFVALAVICLIIACAAFYDYEEGIGFWFLFITLCFGVPGGYWMWEYWPRSDSWNPVYQILF